MDLGKARRWSFPGKKGSDSESQDLSFRHQTFIFREMESTPLLPFRAEAELIALIEAHGIRKTVPAGTVLLKEGAYVAAAPLVLSGLLKVDRVEEDRELLLYYIKPGQSCIMSFSAVLKDGMSQVMAIAEEESDLLLLPADHLKSWHARFPSLQQYYLDLYQEYYEGLLHTIDMLAFHRMDARILDLLQRKATAKESLKLQITHSQIAQELGSTREVVSRVLKKLETEGRVELGRNEVSLPENHS